MNAWLVRSVLFPWQERLKGKATYARLRELEQSQWLSPLALRELQFQQLHRHLEFAYREVPYYTRLLNEHELQPSKIHSLEDFSRIPCLTKQTIRRHFDELRPKNGPRRIKRMSSGGSTGEPVSVFVDMERLAFVDAARIRAHRWFGVEIGDREVALWGSPIELTKQDLARKVRDRLFNSRLLSAFDLGEAALARYATILRRYRPDKIISYPSAIYLLACFLKRHGWIPEPGWPKAIFTTAETLHDFQRRTIQTVFGCAVADEYGCREGGMIASDCPAGGFHINAESVLVEVDRLAHDKGIGGEVVMTNFRSFAMPVIRYRTGDMGELADQRCPCGRGLPLLRSLHGRRSDFLISSSGRVIHGQAAAYLIRETAHIREAIREFQVIQDSLDHLIVKVVPDGGFSAETGHAIVARLALLFSDGHMAIDVEVVDIIERLPSGKHRDVVSKIADRYLENLLS